MVMHYFDHRVSCGISRQHWGCVAWGCDDAGALDCIKFVRIACGRLHRTNRRRCSPSLAQGNVSVAADTPGAAGGNIPSSGEISPTGQYKEGLAVGPWMYYPSIFVGGDYNSNFNQAALINGIRDQQGFRLERTRGSTPDRDGMMVQFTKRLFSQWETSSFSTPIPSVPTRDFHTITNPTQDLTLNFNASYTRETSLFTSALKFNNNAIGPVVRHLLPSRPSSILSERDPA